MWEAGGRKRGEWDVNVGAGRNGAAHAAARGRESGRLVNAAARYLQMADSTTAMPSSLRPGSAVTTQLVAPLGMARTRVSGVEA